jgi:hypothetical protein
MIKDFGEIAFKLSRNPLGVLSLAFVLVYGIAGYICTSTSLQEDDRRILIWFTVFFPLIILITFYRLVTEHSTKLFAPGDFSVESNFLAYTSGHITREQLDRNHRKIHRNLMEYKILNTLWTKQINKWPDLSTFFTFKLFDNTSEYRAFREAGGKLIGEGLINETAEGQYLLTYEGWKYCKLKYKEFPQDQWWPDEKINQDNLAKVVSQEDERS